MIKVGIVGTSVISSWLIEAFKEVEGIEPVAIYSRSMEKARSFALEKSFDRYEQMLLDPEIQMIYVASPNSLHYSYAKAALLSGKHVLCEKPFVSNVEEAKELFQLAEEKGRMIFEGAMTLHLPCVKALKEAVKDVEPVHLVTLNFSQFSSRYQDLLEGKLTNIFDPAYNGGALSDLNIYNIHLALTLFGMPLEVRYYPVLYKNGVDTSGTIVLKYKGFVALLSACKDSYGKSYVHIQGEKGYLYSEEKASLMSSFYNSVKEEEYREAKGRKYYHQVKNIVKILHENNVQEYERLRKSTLEAMEVYEMAKKWLPKFE